jgi:riboflavin kinase/FMN adenylyltransferase
MDVVAGVERLEPQHGPAFAVIGVFDGLHLGHAYLLEHLVSESARRSARPMVITFDHHPDEILTGTAPPLLMDPQERLERLAAAGVTVTVVQHFDEAVRHTTYDAFVDMIASRAGLAGLLMTPDAAFGVERRGTPTALRELGRARGFDVVVVEPFTLDGRAVRSSEVRAAISAGDLATAARLLGRPVTLRGRLVDGTLHLEQPHALPAAGTYPARIGASAGTLTVADGGLRVDVPSGLSLAADTTGGADQPVELRLG